MARSVHTLLVAGVAGGSATLRPFARELSERGVETSIAPAPLFRIASIRKEAMKLRRLILASPEGLRIFAYSMGGLIAALALDDPATSDRVARLVTYGTPYDGTWAAWPGIILGAGWNRNPPEMRPGSHLLERVRYIISDPERLWTFLAVNGKHDWLAPHPQKAVPIGMSRGVPCGHVSFLRDRELLSLLADELLKGCAP